MYVSGHYYIHRNPKPIKINDKPMLLQFSAGENPGGKSLEWRMNK